MAVGAEWRASPSRAKADDEEVAGVYKKAGAKVADMTSDHREWRRSPKRLEGLRREIRAAPTS